MNETPVGIPGLPIITLRQQVIGKPRRVSGSLTDSNAVLYTAPSTAGTMKRARLMLLTFTNLDGSAATVTLYFVAAGDSAGATNVFKSAYSIDAGKDETITFGPEGMPLATGDTIEGYSGTNGVVTYHMGITEE